MRVQSSRGYSKKEKENACAAIQQESQLRIVLFIVGQTDAKALSSRSPPPLHAVQPLVLGFNMSDKDRMDRVWPIITNTEAIAIDHAWAGSPGTLHKTLHNSTVEVWAKPLPEHQVAILVLNIGTLLHITVGVRWHGGGLGGAGCGGWCGGWHDGCRNTAL